MHDLTQLTPFERRLSQRLAVDLATSMRPIDAGAVAATAIGQARRTRTRPRFALVAAAAVLVLAAGMLAVGSGLIRPAPTQAPVPSASEATQSTQASPTPALPTPAATPDPSRPAGFVPAGSMAEPRAEHFAVLLPDGSVLVGAGVGPLFPGSISSREYWNSTERWFAAERDFEVSASLGTTSDVQDFGLTRVNQPAFTLPDGRLLIVPAGCACNPAPVLHAELWSLVDGDAQVRTEDALELARTGHSATLLADGRVLIAGGSMNTFKNGTTATAELWDPVAGTITPTGSMRIDRIGHAATLLADGRVLIIGGQRIEQGPGESSDVDRAEIWDPGTGEFTVAPSLGGITGLARNISNYRIGSDLRMLTMPGGRVLILDGASARTWDPTTERLEDAGAFIVPRTGYAATVLPNGEVLIVGGQSGEDILAAAELWDPVEGFTGAGSLAVARTGPTATTLPDGRVLVVGGFGGIPQPVVAEAELWEPGNAH